MLSNNSPPLTAGDIPVVPSHNWHLWLGQSEGSQPVGQCLSYIANLISNGQFIDQSDWLPRHLLHVHRMCYGATKGAIRSLNKSSKFHSKLYRGSRESDIGPFSGSLRQMGRLGFGTSPPTDLTIELCPDIWNLMNDGAKLGERRDFGSEHG